MESRIEKLKNENIETKTCTKCNKKKTTDGFYKNCAQCKACMLDYQRAWIAKNPEYFKEYQSKNRDKLKAYRKTYYAKNHKTIIDKNRAYCKAFYDDSKNVEARKTYNRAYRTNPKNIEARKAYLIKNVERIKAKYLKRKYDLNWDEYIKLASDQDFKCAICRSVLDMGKYTHVDHCHVTNRVRSILCHRCNSSLGLMRESPNKIRSLLAYCEKWAGPDIIE